MSFTFDDSDDFSRILKCFDKKWIVNDSWSLYKSDDLFIVEFDRI